MNLNDRAAQAWAVLPWMARHRLPPLTALVVQLVVQKDTGAYPVTALLPRRRCRWQVTKPKCLTLIGSSMGIHRRRAFRATARLKVKLWFQKTRSK